MQEAFTNLIEPPFDGAQVARNVVANPYSAAACLELLQRIDSIDSRAALIEESLAYGRLQAGPEHTGWLAARRNPESPAPGKVRVSRHGTALDIRLDRPWAHNAVDRPMRDALREAFNVAALDREIETVKLTARGKAFCIGGELSEFGTTRDPEVAHAIRLETLPAFAIVDCAGRMEAHVQGACIGAGLEMVAFARWVTATSDAWFQLPELAMGLIPGAGGCVSVPRRIGWQRTALLVLSGKRIGARLALDWGLIDEIVSP